MNINLTLLFQVLFFTIFVWFTKRFVWAPVIGALNERRTGIADGLAAAEKGRAAEEEGREQARKEIAKAKTQAAEIIARAEKRGGEIVNESKNNAKIEGQRIIVAARAEADAERSMFVETLRSQVGSLAVDGAREILKREIDEGTHVELLTRLATRL